MTTTVVVTPQLRTEATSLTSQLPPDEALDIKLTTRTEDGTHVVPVPDELSAFLRRIVDALATNEVIRIVALPELLTTTIAAQHLGISRPTLMKLIADKRIPAIKVGSHTRVKSSDVGAFVEQRAVDQDATLAEMRRVEAELGVDEEVADS